MSLQFDDKLKSQEAWILNELQVQKDPTSLRAWLQLLATVTEHADQTYATVAQQESKVLGIEANFSAALSSLIAVNNSVTETYERALRQLPFSYKIWVSYLDARQEHLQVVERLLRRCKIPIVTINSFVSNGQRALLTKFELAAATLPKMPRIWMNLIDACAFYGAGTRLRTAVQGALTELPPSQSRKVWMHIFHNTLQKAEKREINTGVHIPVETYQSLWIRLVNAVPSVLTLESYLHFLIRNKLIDHILICLSALTTSTSPSDIRSLGRKLLRNNTLLWSEVIELLTASSGDDNKANNNNTTFLGAEKRQAIFVHLLSFLKQHYVVSKEDSSSSPSVVDSMELACAIHLCSEGHISSAIESLKAILNTTNSTQHFQRTFQVLLQILSSACELSSATSSADDFQRQAESLLSEYPLLKIAVTLRADPSDPSAWRAKVDILRERLDLALSSGGDEEESRRLIALLEDTYEQAILRLTRFNVKGSTTSSDGILGNITNVDPSASLEVQAGEVSIVASEMLQEYSMFLYGRGYEDKATSVLVKGAFHTQFGHIDHNISLFQRLCDHLVSERKFAHLAAVLARLSFEDTTTTTTISTTSSTVASKSRNMYNDVNARGKRVIGGVFVSNGGGSNNPAAAHAAGLLHYSPTFWELALKYSFICGDHRKEMNGGERIDQKVWEGAKQAGMCSIAVALVYVSQLKQRDLIRQQQRSNSTNSPQSVTLSLSTLLEAKAVLSDTFAACRDPRSKCILATQTLKFFLESKTCQSNTSTSGEATVSSDEPSMESLIESGILRGNHNKSGVSASPLPRVVMFRESLRETVMKALRGTIGMRERSSTTIGKKRDRAEEEKDGEEDTSPKASEEVKRGMASPDEESASIFSSVVKDLILQLINFEAAVSTDDAALAIAQSRISKPNCPLMTALGSAWDLASTTPKFDALDREGELRTISLIVGNSFHQYPLTLSDLLVVVERYLDLVLEIRGIDALRITSTMLLTTANNKHEVAVVAINLAKAEEEVGTIENAARVLKQCWATVTGSADKATKSSSSSSTHTTAFMTFYDGFKSRHPGSLSLQK